MSAFRSRQGESDSSDDDSDDYTEDGENEDEMEVEITPTAEDWKSKGNELYKSKNYSGAIEAYSQAIALDGTSAALRTNRAAAALMLLQYKEALQDCEVAITLDATNSKAYFRKATALKGLGKLDEAIAVLDKGLELEPRSTTAIADRAALVAAKTKLSTIRDLITAKQNSMALRQIEALMKEIGSTFRDLNVLKIEVLLALDRPEDAYNLSNTVMRTAQNGDVQLLRLRAQCFYSLGDLENALKHMQQAVRSDPDNTAVRAYYRRIKQIEELKSGGDVAFRAGKFQEAVDSWTECVAVTKDNRPFSAKLHLNRATALAKLKQHEQAVKDCNTAIYHNDKYIKAYLRRAESYVAMNTPDSIEKGISDYEQAYELESNEESLKSIKMKVKKAKVALKRSKRKDLYAILGVAPDASESEIKTAYRKGALKYHPDKQASKSDAEKEKAVALFKSMGEAYEVLSNPEKKRMYDEGVEVEDLESPGAGMRGGGHGGGMGGGGMGGIDPNVMFQMFMQQQAQGRRR